jgi:prephenate dehydratase
MKIVIAIQGLQASFHDIAANQYFGTGNSRVYCDTFAETIAALMDNRAEYALCAIENSLYGSINEVYDLILANKLFIFGEVYLRIEQCLVGLPGAALDGITSVYSHPVALAQCSQYLDTVLPNAKREEHHDTAASVALLSQLNDPAVAAIASREAAELFEMPILAASIETNKANYTRFFALSKSGAETVLAPDKTSLVIRTNHTPGALYKALGCFASRGLNLTKIQSRPIIGKAWHYMFYFDVEAGINDATYQAAVAELNAQGCTVALLGSYRNANAGN